MLFEVEVAGGETGVLWRIRSAAEELALLGAYFEVDHRGTPIQAHDGTFTIRAEARSRIGGVRDALLGFWGITIIREGNSPENGVALVG